MCYNNYDVEAPLMYGYLSHLSMEHSHYISAADESWTNWICVLSGKKDVYSLQIIFKQSSLKNQNGFITNPLMSPRSCEKCSTSDILGHMIGVLINEILAWVKKNLEYSTPC